MMVHFIISNKCSTFEFFMGINITMMVHGLRPTNHLTDPSIKIVNNVRKINIKFVFLTLQETWVKGHVKWTKRLL